MQSTEARSFPMSGVTILASDVSQQFIHREMLGDQKMNSIKAAVMLYTDQTNRPEAHTDRMIYEKNVKLKIQPQKMQQVSFQEQP